MSRRQNFPGQPISPKVRVPREAGDANWALGRQLHRATCRWELCLLRSKIRLVLLPATTTCLVVTYRRQKMVLARWWVPQLTQDGIMAPGPRILPLTSPISCWRINLSQPRALTWTTLWDSTRECISPWKCQWASDLVCWRQTWDNNNERKQAQNLNISEIPPSTSSKARSR